MAESRQTLTGEVIAAYQRYVAAFLSDDVDTLNALVSYPLAYIGEGVVTMLDAFPVRAATLRAGTGWHQTRDMQYEVVGISDKKAHLILRSGTRVRRDGPPIEDIYAFYAWAKTAAGWQMFAVSDVRVPAGNMR